MLDICRRNIPEGCWNVTKKIAIISSDIICKKVEYLKNMIIRTIENNLYTDNHLYSWIPFVALMRISMGSQILILGSSERAKWINNMYILWLILFPINIHGHYEGYFT